LLNNHSKATITIIGYTNSAIKENGIPNIQAKSSLKTEEQEKVEFRSQTLEIAFHQPNTSSLEASILYAKSVKYRALNEAIIDIITINSSFLSRSLNFIFYLLSFNRANFKFF
jgi:hypothetical protein